MKDTYIFTEIVNAAEVAYIMLRSFVKHHPKTKINVFGTKQDFEKLNSIYLAHENIIIHDISSQQTILEGFKQGHLGTAMLWNFIFRHIANGKKIIHIDSDIFFKKESIWIIQNQLDNGYDIVGSKRCYVNNPGKAPVSSGSPDAISTYFMGFNLEKINIHDYSESDFIKMIQGVYSPLPYMVLDFFDPLTFVALQNGAKINFIDYNIIGGQNELGLKTNNYPLNMHMDNGSNLVHFGGVGSGLSYYKQLSNPEISYSKWALGRWSLFAKVFYNEDILCNIETKIIDGRWCDGNYNQEILNLVKKQIL